MPLYVFKCGDCGYLFEELMGSDSKDNIPCKSCGKTAKKVMSRFASKVSNGSPTESIDMTIGREANKRWQRYHDRQTTRRSGHELQEVQAPHTKAGYEPVMVLGSKNDREKRHEYVGALKDHRKKRIAKGIPQFSGPGEF